MTENEYQNLSTEPKADLHIPLRCSKCGGEFAYKGLGEYECKDCGNLEYDDYGKVRNFLETHVGANAADVERATGVSRQALRRMLDEERIAIKPYSRNTLERPI